MFFCDVLNFDVGLVITDCFEHFLKTLEAQNSFNHLLMEVISPEIFRFLLMLTQLCSLLITSISKSNPDPNLQPLK